MSISTNLKKYFFNNRRYLKILYACISAKNSFCSEYII